MTISVIKPGLLTTVQDLGRTGYQKYGVIASGSMDRFAHRAVNTLVGNEEGEAVLELTVLGPTLQFESPALIALAGANMSARIDGRPLPLWRPVLVRAGAVLQFGAARDGCRTYLAASGGIDVPPVMGSRSTYLRAGIGGFEGRALKAGDRVPLGAPTAFGRRIAAGLDAAAAADGAGASAGSAAQSGARGNDGVDAHSGAADDGGFVSVPWFATYDMMPAYGANPVVRVVEGAQIDRFEPEAVSRFFSGEFTVQPQSDRMGYRLAGESLALRDRSELLSEPVTFGTVQVPPDGNPIVLMADRQTTGGYPKIAQVITADLPILAQAQIGSRIRFTHVSLKEAQENNLMMNVELGLLRRSLWLKFH